MPDIEEIKDIGLNCKICPFYFEKIRAKSA